MQTNIFAPLALNATYDLEAVRQQGLAVGYSASGKPLAYKMTSVFNPYSGLIMSSQEVAKFLIAVLERDTKILSKEMWETLLVPRDEPPHRILLYAGLVAAQEIGEDGRKWMILLSNFNNMSLMLDIFPDIKMAHFTVQNWQTYSVGRNQSFHNPLTQAHTLLIEELPFNSSPLAEKTWPNPKPIAIEQAVGNYSSPVGLVELFAVGEELHGKMMGHEFKIEYVDGNEYLTRSDYKPLDGMHIGLWPDGMNLTPIPWWYFAYRIEDSE
jgi:hypothetical protein